MHPYMYNPAKHKGLRLDVIKNFYSTKKYLRIGLNFEQFDVIIDSTGTEIVKIKWKNVNGCKIGLSEITNLPDVNIG